MVDGGGVGLLPALCLRRMAWVLFTLLIDSCLPPSSGARARERLSVTQKVDYSIGIVYKFPVALKTDNS